MNGLTKNKQAIMIIIETSVTNMLTEFLIISYNEPTNAQLIDK